MAIKLIVTDMDGTLLNDKKEMDPDFWSIYKEIEKRNILFAVASGRQVYNIEKYFSPKKDSIYFVGENGAFVTYRDEILFSDPMDREEVNELIAHARKGNDMEIILCGERSAYIENDTQWFVDGVSGFFGRFNIVDDLTKVEDNIVKISIYDYHNPADNSVPYFDFVKDRYKLTASGPEWADIINLKVNKGEAVKRIQHKHGIKFEETMVFGDYLNDLEMMKTGAYNYAMKNAHRQLLNQASYITKNDNNSGGVVKTIKEVALNNI
ncbi:HAD family hydrolase [Marinilabiliaceae bacterium ANBcel2]|nr:HAD family hydrolase [Marinilabiliaceae bacterium ANBcel2]